MKTKLLILFFMIFSISPIISQVSADIDQYIDPLVKNKDFYGVILVSRNDSIIHLNSYGYANLDWNTENTEKTVFHIASITKQFTAASILVAEQDNLLDLNQKISKFIPDYPNGEKITIEHLLSHRSGIPDYNELDGYEDMVLKENSLSTTIDWFKNQKLLFDPGTKYEYSNSNFVLAAKILELASGSSYSEFLKENVLFPLDMNQTGNFKFNDIVENRATGYDPAPHGLVKSPYYNNFLKLGSGSLYTSIMDLYKWDRALYGNEILSQSSKEKYFKNYGNNYGLGWGIYENDEVGKFMSHDGKSPGFFSYIKRYPNKDRICIIILSNINSGIMNNMKSDITNIVFGKEFALYQPYEIFSLSKDLSEYTGKFDFPPNSYYSIVDKDGDLYFQWMDTPFLQYLTPIGEDRFLMRSRYDYLTFLRDDEGHIISIDYKQRGGITNCPKL